MAAIVPSVVIGRDRMPLFRPQRYLLPCPRGCEGFLSAIIQNVLVLGRLLAVQPRAALTHVHDLPMPGAVEQHDAVLEIAAAHLFSMCLQRDFIDPDLACFSSAKELNPRVLRRSLGLESHFQRLPLRRKSHVLAQAVVVPVGRALGSDGHDFHAMVRTRPECQVIGFPLLQRAVGLAEFDPPRTAGSRDRDACRSRSGMLERSGPGTRPPRAWSG